MKRRIKCIVSSVACIALCIMMLSGCTFEGFNSKADYDVKTVTCVFDYGEIDKAESDLGWHNDYAAKWIIRAGKDARELQPKAYKLALNRCIKTAFDVFVSREKTKNQ